MAINGNTLASLKRGQKGVIKFVDAIDPQVQRLMVLGLVEGAEVEHKSSAIGGDPMEFSVVRMWHFLAPGTREVLPYLTCSGW